MKITLSENYIIYLDEAMFTNDKSLEYHYNKQVLKPGEEFNELDPKFAHISQDEYERLAKELSETSAGSYEKNSNPNNLKNKIFGWKIVNKDTGPEGRYIKIKIPTSATKHNPNMLPEVVIYSLTDDIATYYLVRNFGRRYDEWSQNFVAELPENEKEMDSLNSPIEVDEKLELDEASDINLEYDYKTSDADIDAKDVFDIHRSDSSYSTGLLPGSDEEDYYREHKNKQGTIVYMTPEEYYEACAKGFNNTVDGLKNDRRRHPGPEHIEDIKKIILEKGKKLPIPYLDYTNGFGQEGLHRVMAVADIFGWESEKFPVLVIDFADKQKHIDDLKWHDQRKIENDVIEKSLRYHFEDVEELIDQLKWELERNEYGWEYIKHPENLDVEFDGEYLIFKDPESDFMYKTNEFTDQIVFEEHKESDELPQLSDDDLDEMDALLAAEVTDDDLFL